MRSTNRDGSAWTLDLGIGAIGAAMLAWPDASLVVLAVGLDLRVIVTGLIAIGAGWQTQRLAAESSPHGSSGWPDDDGGQDHISDAIDGSDAIASSDRIILAG